FLLYFDCLVCVKFYYTGLGTVHCVFDNGRTLGVIPGVDDFHIVSEDSEQTEDEEMNMSM
ncbi:DUF4314 domain-containing protein, partial [Ruminococcus bicirculans (ex Wegman et al. 2014)]|uniref:DUF4314 domain-containing protein n=1 Tax=Ruminococcus bicirculans (ex Wegman et al. 2014) TaxID=1160721 RepID=UPI003990896E